MNKRKIAKTVPRAGFTIVETMIVLAVTAVMFISVVLVINGKQQTAEFNSALSDFRTQLQQASNDVANGVYPESNYGCTTPGAPLNKTTYIQQAVSSNGQCAYIGKVMHLYKTGGSADASTFSTYTIVGARDATTYPDAHMLLVAATNGSRPRNNPLGTAVDKTASNRLQYGLTVQRMTYSTDTVTKRDVGSFALVQSLNAGVDGRSDGTGVSQHSQLLVLLGNGAAAPASSRIENDQTTEATRVNELLDRSLPPDGYTTEGTIDICVKSGTTNQWATISISNGSSQLDLATKITNTDCSA